MTLVRIVTGTRQELSASLEAAIAAYRHEIFVRRLGWRLACADGFERDQFDRPDTNYVAMLDQRGEICGCARLLPTNRPYLLAEVFPAAMGDEPLPRSAAVWELSRFAVASLSRQQLPADALARLRRALLRAAVKCAADHGARRLITLSPLGIERLLRHLGVHARRAAAPTRVDGKWAFACWIEIDRRTCSALDVAFLESARGRKVDATALLAKCSPTLVHHVAESEFA
jgi:acyl homoserine lactone synthase